MRSHTRKLLTCEICFKKFGEKSFSNHVSKCLEKESLSYKKCEKCNKDYKSYTGRFCSRSCANSHFVSEEHKSKTSKSLNKSNSESMSFLLKRQNKNCKYCGADTKSINNKPTKNFCTPLCDDFKKHRSLAISLKVKGKTGGYREKGGRGKGCFYRQVWLDSSWELALVKRLDELNILWERDTSKYKFVYFDKFGNSRNYYPDFYLPKFDIFIEVKGYWTQETKHKMSSVKENNKHLNILILESLCEIEKLNID